MTTFEAIDIIESGPEDRAQYLEAWQHLIDTGVCWGLQGWYGRTAIRHIESGDCTPPQNHSH